MSQMYSLKNLKYTLKLGGKIHRSHSKSNVLPLKFLCMISKHKSQEMDFSFLKDIIPISSAPDYSGYNTKLRRKQGCEIKSKTNVLYSPLINEKSFDLSTILTAMHAVEKVTKKAGREISILTCDRQLYRVVVNIMWADPKQWLQFFSHLRGMYIHMSFIGFVGNLMGGSGLSTLMGKAIAGVEKMLLRTKFHMNLRGLQFVVIELLRVIIADS